jgi:hypothetical protein
MERLPYAVNFDRKLVMALWSDEVSGDFENLVLTTRRIASLEETVVATSAISMTVFVRAKPSREKVTRLIFPMPLQLMHLRLNTIMCRTNPRPLQ